MKKIGYARVSTRDQNLDMQLHALKEAGCEQIFTEKKSGRKMDRPILKKLIKQSSAGDTIIVWKIDRIGRSAKDLCEVIDILRSIIRKSKCSRVSKRKVHFTKRSV